MNYDYRMKYITIILWLSLFLAGCGMLPEQRATPVATPTLVVTSMPEQERDGKQPTAPAEVEPPPPTEETFLHDTIFLEGFEIRSDPDQPGLVFLHIEGQLPTPCHQFGSQICPACAQNAPNLIEVNVYSLIETGRVCRGPTTPFEQDIPLGVYTAGVYSVAVNGQHVGTFDAAKMGHEEALMEMIRGNVFIEETQMTAPEAAGEQVRLTIQGYMPTPCHLFQADVSVPNEKNEIQVEAYSLVPAGQACIQVIQDFTTDVQLGLLPGGTYSVWLNGEELGEVVIR